MCAWKGKLSANCGRLSGLVLAEAGGAAAASAAAGAAGGAGGHGGRGAFGDGSGAAADEAMDAAGAGGTGFKGGVGHLLALVKARAAIVAEVFVGGHGVWVDGTLRRDGVRGVVSQVSADGSNSVP